MSFSLPFLALVLLPLGGLLAWLVVRHAIAAVRSRGDAYEVGVVVLAVLALTVVALAIFAGLHFLVYVAFALVLGLSHLTTRKARRDVLALEAAVSARTRELDAQQAALEGVLERLRTSEARYRQLADMALEGIVVHREGRIVDVNPAMCRLGGYEAEELRGRPLAILFTPGEATRLRGRISFGSLETLACRRDGSTYPVEVSARAHGDHGVVVIRDVSERRELQARLALADRMVSLGTLAAGVAHEVNNPLTYVLTNVEFALAELEASRAGPEVERALVDARDGCHRARRIVSEMRRLSRTDEQAPGPVDLRRVIDAALQMAGNEIRHRARLVVEHGDIPTVLGDESKLAQVVLNLVLNAAQAMPVGRVDSMTLRVRTRCDERGRAVLEVSDTGQGIASEHLARIFDPFFTTKPVGHGTGLGLAICQSIVSASGGEIGVESEVGRGTTFRVALPVTDEAPSSESLPRLRAAKPVARARVLVVDDEPAVVRAVARILRDHDVQVTTRASEALELCRAHRFDVIVSDLMMPEMSGMEFHARLSAEAPELARRMTFMTGGAFAASAQEFLATVDAPHITKPFDAARLHAAIDAILRRAA